MLIYYESNYLYIRPHYLTIVWCGVDDLLLLSTQGPRYSSHSSGLVVTVRRTDPGECRDTWR